MPTDPAHVPIRCTLYLKINYIIRVRTLVFHFKIIKRKISIFNYYFYRCRETYFIFKTEHSLGFTLWNYLIVIVYKNYHLQSKVYIFQWIKFQLKVIRERYLHVYIKVTKLLYLECFAIVSDRIRDRYSFCMVTQLSPMFHSVHLSHFYLLETIRYLFIFISYKVDSGTFRTQIVFNNDSLEQFAFPSRLRDNSFFRFLTQTLTISNVFISLTFDWCFSIDKEISIARDQTEI